MLKEGSFDGIIAELSEDRFCAKCDRKTKHDDILGCLVHYDGWFGRYTRENLKFVSLDEGVTQVSKE